MGAVLFFIVAPTQVTFSRPSSLVDVLTAVFLAPVVRGVEEIFGAVALVAVLHL